MQRYVCKQSQGLNMVWEMGDLDYLHFWAPDCCMNECLIAPTTI